MIPFVITYCLLYGVLILLIVFTGFFLQVRKESSYENEKGFELDEISVIIPFRDEESRLEGLIKSIQQATVLPKEIIFVDDHSADNGIKIIEKELEGYPVKVIKMSADLVGKKKAIRFGMEQCSGKYLLTLDADVNFNKEFFKNLESLERCTMYVRPAVMKANRLTEYFYEIDLALVNAVNVGVAGWKRPIMASGANLMCNIEVFKRIDSIQCHEQVASGDDMYALKDFRENGESIRLISNLEHAIYTETPQSFSEFINQRLRWLGKTSDLKDNLSTVLAIVQTILTLMFFVIVIGSICQLDYRALCMLVGIKTMIDLLAFLPYLKRIKRIKTWLFIPLYELFFPFYILILIGGLFFYKPKWKGRVVKHK
tara:strand:- start:2100 stop:3209 length:1110 start_codon:yes stop_codon:yes gene_type:complete